MDARYVVSCLWCVWLFDGFFTKAVGATSSADYTVRRRFSCVVISNELC